MTTQQTDKDALREQVRARYAAAAAQVTKRAGRLWLWPARRLWL